MSGAEGSAPRSREAPADAEASWPGDARAGSPTPSARPGRLCWGRRAGTPVPAPPSPSPSRADSGPPAASRPDGQGSRSAVYSREPGQRPGCTSNSTGRPAARTRSAPGPRGRSPRPASPESGVAPPLPPSSAQRGEDRAGRAGPREGLPGTRSAPGRRLRRAPTEQQRPRAERARSNACGGAERGGPLGVGAP